LKKRSNEKNALEIMFNDLTKTAIENHLKKKTFNDIANSKDYQGRGSSASRK